MSESKLPRYFKQAITRYGLIDGIRANDWIIEILTPAQMNELEKSAAYTNGNIYEVASPQSTTAVKEKVISPVESDKELLDINSLFSDEQRKQLKELDKSYIQTIVLNVVNILEHATVDKPKTVEVPKQTMVTITDEVPETKELPPSSDKTGEDEVKTDTPSPETKTGKEKTVKEKIASAQKIMIEKSKTAGEKRIEQTKAQTSLDTLLKKKKKSAKDKKQITALNESVTALNSEVSKLESDIREIQQMTGIGQKNITKSSGKPDDEIVLEDLE